MPFQWDEEKNRQLQAERGICFEDIVIAIHEGKLLDVVKHPNQAKYPDQLLYIVELMDYVYMVPFVKDRETMFLKTIIPSRKLKKMYKGE
mgnify:FL=1